MNRRAIVDLYAWVTGTCFRCDQEGVPTALLAVLSPPAGGIYEVRACEDCIVRLEEERARYADRRGLEYRPGELGRRGGSRPESRGESGE